MITTIEKAAIVKEFGAEFGAGEKDAGCTAVQVAILTARINGLMTHFEKHIHDYHSNRGLLKMIGSRKSHLKYMAKKDSTKYKTLIAKLGLRK